MEKRNIYNYKQFPSPYAQNYKHTMRCDQRDLLTTRLRISKFTRRELEDKYYNSCDENITIKRENHENRLKIKQLTTKLLRVSSTKAHDILSADEHLQIRVIDLENQNAQLRDKVVLYQKFAPKSSKFASACDVRSAMDIDVVNRSKSVASPQYKNDEVIVTNDKEIMTSLTSPEPEIKKELENLRVQVDELKFELEKSTKTNAELSTELLDVKNKISALKINKNLEENSKIVELRICYEQAKQQIEKITKDRNAIQTESQAALERERNRISVLEIRLEKDTDKLMDLEKKSSSPELGQKLIEQLQKNLSETQIERDSLKAQQENIKMLLEDAVVQKARIEELERENYETNQKLENEFSSSQSIKYSQNELLDKIKVLQGQNDDLMLEVDGKRSQFISLTQRIEELEKSLVLIKGIRKTLEKENFKLKEQLREFIEKTSKNNLVIENTDNWSNKKNLLTAHNETVTIAEPPSKEIETSSKLIQTENDQVGTSKRINQDCNFNCEQPKYFKENCRFKIRNSVNTHLDNIFERIDLKTHLDILERAAYYPNKSKKLKTTSDPILISTIHNRKTRHKTKQKPQSSSESTESMRTVCNNDDKNSSSLNDSDSSSTRKINTSAFKKMIEQFSPAHGSHSMHHQESISLKISSLELKKSALNSLDSNKIHIEYSFVEPDDKILHTTKMLPHKESGKKIKYLFNYRKTFVIDRTDNLQEFHKLLSILDETTGDDIKFSVVVDDAGGREIGFGYFKLSEFLNDLDDDCNVSRIEIFNVDFPHLKIGKLKVEINGVLIMKNFKRFLVETVADSNSSCSSNI